MPPQPRSRAPNVRYSTQTGGETSIWTAGFTVGAVHAVHTLPTVDLGPVYPPTFDYGKQATVSAPPWRLSNFDWGHVRGSSELEIAIANDVAEIPDCNQTNGIRFLQEGRTISATGTVFTNTDAPGAAYDIEQLLATAPPSGTLSYRYATAGAAEANGMLFEMPEPQTNSVTYDKRGDAVQASIDVNATSTTANTEFSLTFD